MRARPSWRGPAAVIPPIVACLLAASGCGADKSGFHGTDGGTPVEDGVAPSDAPILPTDAIHLNGDGSVDATASGSAVVYAETKDTLYRLDPVTNKLSTIGPFTGCSEVLDIALDSDSTMFATTLDGLYTIDTSTAACTLVASCSAVPSCAAMANYPNSLSFVPVGTLDPAVEALVGYVGGTYVRIDTKSGALTTVGSIGQGYSSSGDIVSVKGGGTYLTVKDGPGACNDCLIQVDPTTGAFLFDWGPLGATRSNVYGIAFWGGAVYGFDTAGNLFAIRFDGMAMQITDLPFPGEPAGLQWFGAGSTTVAPLVPPK